MTDVPVTNLTWTFDPDRNDGGILVDSVDNDMPEYRPGKSYSLDLVFWPNTDDSLTVLAETGGTAGGQAGFTLGGANGGTLGSPQGQSSHLLRYEKVREYTRWAGRYAITETIDGTRRITEHTPADASVDSIVVELVPKSGLTATDAIWVILDDVDDATRFADDMARISLRFTVLARGDQYPSRSALKNDLGSDLV